MLCLLAAIWAGNGAAAPGPLIRCPDWLHPTSVLSITARVKPDAAPPAQREASAKPARQTTPDQDCRRHTIRKGDTLGKIAQQYLGDTARHPEIAAFNPETAANPKNLRVGTELIISCPPRPTRSKQNEDKESGWLSRLFGNGAKAETPSAETNAGSSSPEIVRSPHKVPVWTAEKGEYLIDVLERWGTAAGYEVIIEDRGDWRFRVPFKVEGPLKIALQEVIKGFGSGPSAPLLVLYANRVIRVGAAR